MPFQNYRRESEFKNELIQLRKQLTRRAQFFSAQSRRAAPDGAVNEELRALRVKIAKVYDDLADVIENRLFKEW